MLSAEFVQTQMHRGHGAESQGLDRGVQLFHWRCIRRRCPGTDSMEYHHQIHLQLQLRHTESPHRLLTMQSRSLNAYERCHLKSDLSCKAAGDEQYPHLALTRLSNRQVLCRD